MTDKTKLGIALQDAALANISEDIQSICCSLEKITNDLPEEVRKQLVLLNEDIEALSLGLKAVPEQFDLDFSKKIHRVLDVVADVELHTKKLNNTIQADNSVQINKQAEQLARAFNSKLKGFHIISGMRLFFWGLACSMFGGFVSSVIAWVVFPLLF